MIDTVSWFTKGEVGEAVRDVMDSFLEDIIDSSTAIATLSSMGLSNDEMMSLLEQELEVQQATFH
tara:strand:+ start:300 stop:494 length:195 start_codon:yes stop_codon:yes gene_type:complete